MFDKIIWILTLHLFVGSVIGFDFSKVFKTPDRDYDKFEILERSNFESNDNKPSEENQKNGGDKSKSFANAQILLRIGDEPKKSSCNCGSNCQCQCSCCCPMPLPYYFSPYSPYQMPQPIPIREETKERIIIPNIPLEITQPKPEVIEKIPEQASMSIPRKTTPIVKEIYSTEKEDEDSSEELKQSIVNKLNGQSNSANIKFVPLELPQTKEKTTEVEEKFKDALIPYTCSKCTSPKPKLLLTYPIFDEHPPVEEIAKDLEKLKKEDSSKGPSIYENFPLPGDFRSFFQAVKVRESSSSYSDPTKTITYRQPPLIQYTHGNIQGTTPPTRSCICMIIPKFSPPPMKTMVLPSYFLQSPFMSPYTQLPQYPIIPPFFPQFCMQPTIITKPENKVTKLPIPPLDPDDCGCISCAKYQREMNEI